VVRDFNVLIVEQFDIRNHFELGGEAQRLAVLEMDVLDIGSGDDGQVLGLEPLLEMHGNQALQYLVPNLSGIFLADDGNGNLSRTKATELGAFLDVLEHPAGLTLHILNGDGDFERVPATFD
jgi:hypothetical protein